MSEAVHYTGDVFDVIATLPEKSVDLVLSSPPFLALRSYLPADHPDKNKEIGSEATPADFVDTLLDVVEACDRVLAPHGSLVFELGDSYAGSGGAGGDYGTGGLREGQAKFNGSALADRKNKVLRADGNRLQQGPGWPLDKSLCGVPTLFAWSLAYGRNLLRPERTTDQWRIRNVVPWARRNPPVGALGDKWRPATSYLTIATKARDRYWDGDATRVQASENTHAGTATGVASQPATGKQADDERRGGNFSTLDVLHDTSGAPLLDWWYVDELAEQFADLFEPGFLQVNTAAYKGAHYACYPPALCVPPILAMCPERVCRVCGEPSRRITETTQGDTGRTTNGAKPRDRSESFAGTTYEKCTLARTTTLGWTDCGHNAWRPGIVLDPFGGSGTTGQVATGNGRNAVLIDLDERNVVLALGRIGMFCQVAPVGKLPDWLATPGTYALEPAS